MSFGQAFKYVCSTIGIYLGIFACEYFFIKPLIDGFGLSWIAMLLITCVSALVINPVLTFFAMEKLPFKPEGLKIQNND